MNSEMLSPSQVSDLKRLYSEFEQDVVIKYEFDPGDGKTFQQFNDHFLNFREAMKLPIHRWFEYKEGFSPDLILNLIRRLKMDTSRIILDPFCGGGTLPVTCFYENISSVGIEANPFSHFLAKVKTRAYPRAEVVEIEKILPKLNVPHPQDVSIDIEFSMMDRLFHPVILDSLLQIRANIRELCGERTQSGDFFQLAWLAVLENLSNYRKAGNGLKRKVKRKIPVPKYGESGREPQRDIAPLVSRAFHAKASSMIEDLKSSPSPQVSEPRIILDSCLDLSSYLGPNSVGGCIFSPPYLNCFDYCEIYKIELWLGGFVDGYGALKNLRSQSLVSHLNNQRLRQVSPPSSVENILTPLLNLVDPGQLWDAKIPRMIQGYFQDMERLLEQLARVHEPGKHTVIVVSNSSYGGVVFPTDLILGKIGERCGFILEKIQPVRPIVTSSQQFHFLKHNNLTPWMRESLVYLRRREAA